MSAPGPTGLAMPGASQPTSGAGTQQPGPAKFPGAQQLYDPNTGVVIQQQMQVMPDGSMVPLPPPPPIVKSHWLDDTGLMFYEPEPLKVGRKGCDIGPLVIVFPS